jgi:hypothetical protein
MCIFNTFFLLTLVNYCTRCTEKYNGKIIHIILYIYPYSSFCINSHAAQQGRMEEVGGEEWQENVYNREEWKKLLRMARNHRILHMPME